MSANPLPVDLWGYAPEDAAQLVKLVIDECVDGAAPDRSTEAIPKAISAMPAIDYLCREFEARSDRRP